MLALFKLRRDFFLRSYSLKIASVISNLLLPISFNFEEIGKYYGFVIIQGMLFTFLDGSTQYFYKNKRVGLSTIIFISIFIFNVSFVTYKFLFHELSKFDILLIVGSFIFYPVKYFYLFLFNSTGRREGFYCELAENVTSLIAVTLAIIFNLNIEFVICVFILRSSIYLLLGNKWLFNGITLDGSFDRKDYLKFSYQLIITSIINMAIIFSPNYFLGINEFGKYSFVTRLMNLLAEPIKIILNANFTKFNMDSDHVSLSKQTRTMETRYYLLLVSLAIISLFFEESRSNLYYLAPLIIITEIDAISYFTKRKMIGITKNNGIYNFLYFLSLSLFFNYLDGEYWILWMFASRLICLLYIRLFDYYCVSS